MRTVTVVAPKSRGDIAQCGGPFRVVFDSHNFIQALQTQRAAVAIAGG
jgi:hypothetical protein